MATLGDEIERRRASRMRLGQQTGIKVPLLSDPEIEIFLVPITDGQKQMALDVAASGNEPENAHGMLVREEKFKNEVIAFSARNPGNLEERVWDSGKALLQVDDADKLHLWDSYMEMSNRISPSILTLKEEDLEELKKALQQIRWSELSGRQWYAAERFLLSIQEELLKASLPGSSSTNSLTMMNVAAESIPSASPS